MGNRNSFVDKTDTVTSVYPIAMRTLKHRYSHDLQANTTYNVSGLTILYAIHMLDLLSGRVTIDDYLAELADIGLHLAKIVGVEVEPLMDFIRVHDHAFRLPELMTIHVLSATETMETVRALYAIPHKVVRRLLMERTMTYWSVVEFWKIKPLYLIESEYSAGGGVFTDNHIEQAVHGICPSSSTLLTLFVLFLFIQCRYYYHWVRDTFAVQLIGVVSFFEHCEEYERFLLRTSRPEDDLDISQHLRDLHMKMRECTQNQKQLSHLTDLTGFEISTTVCNYIKTVLNEKAANW